MWWMGAIQAGMGIAQTAIAASKASKLPQDQKYTASPEFRAAFEQARTRSQQGFSPEEQAAFDQSLARQGTAAKRMLQNVGLSGAGAAAANIMSADALNQFAAQDANIQRQNFGQYMNAARGMQSIQDAETNRFNTQLNMQRQALGGAMQSGLSNIMGGINTGINAQQMSNAMKNGQTGQLPGTTTGATSDTTTNQVGGAFNSPSINSNQGGVDPYMQFMPQVAPQNGGGLGVYDFNQGASNFYQF